MITIDEEFYKDLLDKLYDGVYFVNRSRMITYWNEGAERITGYRSDEVIGRHCWDNILRHVNEQGLSLCEGERCPASDSMSRVDTCEEAVYLRHKDGHRVPVLTRINPIVAPDGTIVGAVEVFSENRDALESRKKIHELEKTALTDWLTKLGNRRLAETKLKSSLNEFQRYDRPFGILFIDVDHFKIINDLYGHETGDNILKMVSKTMANSIRSSDTLCRWGGEEFLAIMPNVDREKALAVADKLRALVERSSISDDLGRLRASVSVGIALARTDDDVESLIARADRAMYASKAAGRNKVTIDSGSLTLDTSLTSKVV
jgi:diguanylate cyclase (GGDEF)-like protein/PAS domain S-box-containing protein